MADTVHPGVSYSDASVYTAHGTVADLRPVNVTGQTTQYVPAVVGAYLTPTVLNDGPQAVGLHRTFLHDFYYRIWVIPSVIQAQNPQYNAPIEFNIWNAYPEPVTNTLVSIDATGATGLDVLPAAGYVFDALEYKLASVTITTAAPIQIDAEFTFNFTTGSGTLTFSATVADFVQMRPDPPVTEYWDWLTDVMTSWDGTEQRVALRQAPRRNVSYKIGLDGEADRRRQYGRWYKSLATRLVFPYYQYATVLTQESVIGATKIFFDPARTDVRDGDFVVVLDEWTEAGYLVKLDTVEADGATLDSPLTVDLTARMIVAPAFASRLADGSGLDMKIVSGTLNVDAQALDVRTAFARPGSTAVIEVFDGYNVLDRRPLAEGETPERFHVNYEVIDSETGLLDIKSSWPHPRIETARKYAIHRATDPNEMDWWRDFLDDAKGMQKAFLAPSWFSDLVLTENPAPSANSCTISSMDYASLYFPYDTFKRLQFELADGRLVWRKVLSAVDNGDGTQTLNLDSAFGGNPQDVDVLKVSYLYRCRLGLDRVTLTHGHLRTVLEITIRTIDL